MTLLDSQAKCIRRIRYLMGAFIRIEAAGEASQDVSSAVEAAFSEIKRIENSLSRFLPASDISRVNQFAFEFPVPVSSDVFDLLGRCLYYSSFTQGAFDVTLTPYTELWHRAENRNQLPSEREIAAASWCTGPQHLLLDRPTQTVRFLRPGMKIDLGAVGKGYAVDRAIQIMRAKGLAEALIDAGSSIFSLSHDACCFGITDPCSISEIISTVSLRNNALSTSGNYERYFSIRGRRFGHLLDPYTGHPARSDLLSVTMVGEQAFTCEILSTAALVMGREKAASLINSLPGTKAVFVIPDNGSYGAKALAL